MKKGFTLVELLGVITILGVIVLIVVPATKNVISDSKNKLYDAQISNISSALKNWAGDNSRLLPEQEGETITITLGQLKAGGYIDSEILNPNNNKCFGNDMLLAVTRHQKNYIYDVIEETNTETDTCDNFLKPYIVLNGEAITYVEVGSEYVELGASAVGSDGTPISDNITTSISDTIDTSVVGNSYTITYTVTEGTTTTSIKRKVIINDTISPELIIPDNAILEKKDSSFNVMEDVSAIDNSGEIVNITSKSNISFGIPGEYVITYTATDSSGNKTTKKRIVSIKKAYGNAILSSDYDCVIKGNICEPGTLVEVNVNDNTKYNFYVINDDGNELTLIMDRNLYSEDDKNNGNISWISQEDYDNDVDWGTYGNANKGPLTAIAALKQRTNSWKNIEEKTYIIKDDQWNRYPAISENMRARMLTYQEAKDLGCTTTIGSCPDYLYSNLKSSTEPGYWLPSTMDKSKVYFVHHTKRMYFYNLSTAADVHGIRPVITLTK